MSNAKPRLNERQRKSTLSAFSRVANALESYGQKEAAASMRRGLRALKPQGQ